MGKLTLCSSAHKLRFATSVQDSFTHQTQTGRDGPARLLLDGCRTEFLTVIV
jgi:hypothetical protein